MDPEDIPVGIGVGHNFAGSARSLEDVGDRFAVAAHGLRTLISR